MIENYDIDYWFNQHELHGNVYGYGRAYYAYKIFENLVLHLDDIPHGFIVVMGTNRCVSFDLLCQHFGSDRCLGFDIANPTQHEKVIIKNCLDLGKKDNVPIAFVHNDVGNFTQTPLAKMHAQLWAANNVVPGGYFLGRNNRNSLGIDLESAMLGLNYENYQLEHMHSDYLIGIPDYQIVSHMLSKRKKPVCQTAQASDHVL